MTETANGATTEPGAPAPTATSESSTPPPASDVSDIAATLAGERPDVQPHAIEAAKAQTAAEVKLDKAGTAFDPSKHTGSILKDGTWRTRKGVPAGPAGAAAPSAGKSPSKLGGPTNAPTPTNNKEIAGRASGKAAASLLLMAGVGLGGEEWQPRLDDKLGIDERGMLEMAFGDYFVATGKTDIPPGWALVAAVGMYALPRFAMPKTRSRLAVVKSWIGAKIVKWKAKRAGIHVDVEPGK